MKTLTDVKNNQQQAAETHPGSRAQSEHSDRRADGVSSATCHHKQDKKVQNNRMLEEQRSYTRLRDKMGKCESCAEVVQVGEGP